MTKIFNINATKCKHFLIFVKKMLTLDWLKVLKMKASIVVLYLIILHRVFSLSLSLFLSSLSSLSLLLLHAYLKFSTNTFLDKLNKIMQVLPFSISSFQ